MSRSEALPWIAFAAISLIWGSTWLGHKWALEDFTPAGLSTIRLGLAGIGCLILGFMRGERWPQRRELPMLLATGLVLTGLANFLTSWSLLYIPSGIGAVLQAPIPVWMALFAMRTDPLSGRGWLAVPAGFFGVALVVWPSSVNSIPVWPAVVCVVTAAAWSFASLLQRKHVRQGGLYLNAALPMLLSASIGAVLSPLGFDYTHGHGVSLRAWISLAYLVVFGSMIAFASYIYLTRVWHPARAGSFSYLNPVVAVALGVWLANEQLSLRLILGMAVILVSVWMLNTATRKPKAAVVARSQSEA